MIGSKLAHYEITSHLGTGGMGEVYQATDSKLGRSVAIKLLPEAFRDDNDRAVRFEREARVLASLNHPHIAAIYGIEEASQRKFLVMELVLGETLAERVRRGPIPVDESLVIAKSICEALEAAHEKGIIHRDLKPANVKITPEGKVKVLDFGLAKALESPPADTTLSNSPTLSMAATKAGVILGTAAYMSPEQAKGKETDRTTDIWAFGCVLFEMLTGRSAFEGESLGEILGSVFKSEPDWAALPATTPSAIVSLLKRCLQKNRSRRMRDSADARFQIEEALASPVNTVAPVPATRRNRERIVVGVLLVVIAALSVVAILNFRSPPNDTMEMRLDVSTPPGADLGSFALSPDGSNVVFTAPKEGRTQLWIRPLNSETAQPIAGTEGAEGDPFWSPNSKSIAFFAGGMLRRVEAAGGPVQALVKAEGNGGSWNTNGVILFAPNYGGALYRIPDTSGEPIAVTSLDPPRVTVQVFPQFLPDGHHFLFFGYGPREFMGIYIGSLESKQTARLFAADSNAVFAAPDWVLFDRQGALLAQRLDLNTFKPIGDPLRVSPNVALNSSTLEIAVSASSAGLIAFRARGAERQLVLVDRSNHQIGNVGGPDAALMQEGLRLSPTGRTVGTVRRIDQESNIWLTDIGTGATRQLTSGAVWHSLPVWSHDEMRIAFSADPTGIAAIYEISAMGNGAGNPLLPTAAENYALDWSPDGRYLLYRIVDIDRSSVIWALPLIGDKKEPLELARAAYRGLFSPDGHWVAYESNETGQPEIWLQPFPPTGSKSQITTNFGFQPQWRRDGRELFYVGQDNWLMAMPLTSNGVKGGDPTRLFLLPPASYFATSNGQQFLISKIVKDQAPITILQNWKARSK